MSDEPFYSPTAKPAPARVARPGGLLFHFIRGSDRAPMSCELRFHGESFGWEAQFFERDDLCDAHGAFVRKAAAIRWAGEEHGRRWRRVGSMASVSHGATSTGISLGSAIAVTVSWSLHHSLLWAVIHGIFGWFYVIYYALTRR